MCIRQKNNDIPFSDTPLISFSSPEKGGEQSTSLIQMMMDNVADLIWAKNMKEEFVFVNRAMCEQLLMCKKTADALGKTDLYFAGREKELGYQHTFGEICVNSDEIVKASKQSGKFIEEGYVRGKYLVLEVNKAPIFDKSGKMIGTVGCGRDITDCKQIEKEKADALKFALEQAKYALVGQVAGKMAHDFNNILGAIMGNAEIALMDSREKETVESLNVILDQTLRGKELTQNLAAFAKDQEPKEAYFDLHSKIDLTLHLFCQELNNTAVKKKFMTDMPELLADPDMMEHALVNLIQNAIHAMGMTKDPVLKIKTYTDKTRVFVEISDNGCGIPEKYHDDIYVPSFTLKGSKDSTGAYDTGIKGAGYGLSIVKKYIEKHKGQIFFKSIEGKGTQFTLSLPVIQKDPGSKEKKMFSQQGIIKGKNILLVEDESAISQVQYKILTSDPFCHAVTVAQSAETAIQAFDRERFDLVSLDYLLPGRLNGLDVYRHIRKKDLSVPIVFVSGNIEFLESMKSLGSTDERMDHVSKPCENRVYADIINKWLFPG